MRALPAVARRVSSNPDAYVYLAESIRAWPDQAGPRPPASRPPAGRTSAWRNLTGGIVALHRAHRPALDLVRARVSARPPRQGTPGARS